MVKHLEVGGEASNRTKPAATELRLTTRIRELAQVVRAPGVVLGIGDDCAIYRPRGASEDMLFTTDLLVEGTHFLRETHTPEDIGWKAVARGLSDIAAMGGEPRFCLVSLALTKQDVGKWIDRFHRGLLKLASREGAPLLGGDVASGDRFVCDIVVVGAVPRRTAILRSTARAGDAIYVSGKLGGSAYGLATGRGQAWKRHLRPEPRLRLGRFLRGRATAAMDLSDGISLDLCRLGLASGLQASIQAPPRFSGATLEQALHGGEDYELLFTAPPATRIPRQFEGLSLTRIGVMEKGIPGAIRLDGTKLPTLGYDHFRKP